MTETTIAGNLVGDIEIRVTNSGQTVGNCRVAVNEGKDKPSSFYKVTLWDDLASNALDSVSKGDRVIASGRLKVREYMTDAGVKGQSTEITASLFGPDLRWAVAKPVKNQDSARGGNPAPAGGSGAASWGTNTPGTVSGAHSGAQGDTSMWDQALTPNGSTETPF